MKAVEWRKAKVRYLDQTKLPSREIYEETDDVKRLAEAIRVLSIRGAPLIGIAAAYAVVLAANKCTTKDPASRSAYFDKNINVLAGTRPTAINLFWALDRQRKVVLQNQDNSLRVLRAALLQEARRIHDEDAAMCVAIGKHGSELLPNAASVLTHCNTGSLATGGIGTALGIVRTCWEQHKLRHVYIDETRPLLQGARLTAWELQKDGIPSTLIADNTAGFLMQQGRINAVIVGADRIAANGDVANKVGTYSLAVLAHHHGIPMIVAAPTSSVDLNTKDGKDIPIEQRHARELIELSGKRMAPEKSEVYSPAFDITPSELVSAIVTEQGVMRAPYAQSLKSGSRSRED